MTINEFKDLIKILDLDEDHEVEILQDEQYKNMYNVFRKIEIDEPLLFILETDKNNKIIRTYT